MDSSSVDTITLDDELISAAQEEGSLVIRYSSPVTFMETIAKKFTDKYGIEIQLDRRSGAPGNEQFQTEERAGQHVIDVLEASEFSYLPRFADEGLVARHKFEPAIQEKLTGAAALPDDAGYLVYWNDIAIEYNTEKVSHELAKEKFKTWEGLLDPAFKDQVGLFLPTGTSAFSLLLMFYEDSKYGPEFLNKLRDHGVHLFDGSAEAREALLAGEISVYIPGTESQELEQVANGASIAWANPEKIPHLAASYIVISRNAPHPNAARLFAAWIQSDEGQQAIAEMNRTPARVEYGDQRPALELLKKTSWYEPKSPESLWVPTLDQLFQYGELQPDMYKRLGASG